MSFFTDLFDISFKKNLTPKVIGYIYLLLIIGAGISVLGLIKVSLFAFIGGLIFFLGFVLSLRCMMEIILIIFNINRYTAEIARKLRTLESLDNKNIQIPVPPKK